MHIQIDEWGDKAQLIIMDDGTTRQYFFVVSSSTPNYILGNDGLHIVSNFYPEIVNLYENHKGFTDWEKATRAYQTYIHHISQLEEEPI